MTRHRFLLALLPVVSLASDDRGITCRTTAVSTGTMVRFLDEKPLVTHSLEVTATLSAPIATAVFSVLAADVTEVTDATGTCLDGPAREAPPELNHRERLSDRIFQCFMNRAVRQEETVIARAAGLHRLPARGGTIRCLVTTIAATKISMTPFAMEVTEEAIAIAPGVALLVTRYASDANLTHFAYEVRSARKKDTQPPLFVGILLRDATGQVIQCLRPDRRLMTRDEEICVLSITSMSVAGAASVATFEAIVLDGLASRTFDFTVAAP